MHQRCRFALASFVPLALCKAQLRSAAKSDDQSSDQLPASLNKCHVARKCKNALVHARSCSLFENHFQDICAIRLGNSANMTVCHYQTKRSKPAHIIKLGTRYQIKHMTKLLKFMDPDSYI